MLLQGGLQASLTVMFIQGLFKFIHEFIDILLKSWQVTKMNMHQGTPP